MSDPSPPDDNRWELTDQPTDAQVAALRQQLGQYNISTAHIDEGQDLAVFVHAPDGELIAGIVGWTWGQCLEISFLWVHPGYRERGYGARLVRQIEAAAVARACQVSALDTYSFQAPAFYEKLGYEAFGVIDGYPRGYQKIFYRKRLA
jgi:ribosomal protein S18 acetylase RimI-like enzyme